MPFTIRSTPEKWLSKGETRAPSKSDKPLIVWGGIVGEQAEFRVTHKGLNQIYGTFDHTETPSRHRVDVPCDRYDSCGGCPMMHVDADGQRKAHEDRTRESLDIAGLGDIVVKGWTPSPERYGFRHVVKLGWGYSRDGKRIKVGAWGRRDRNIIPIPNCDVASPGLRRVMTSLAHHAIEMGLEPYDPETERGVMRGAVIRESQSTGEIMLVLVTGRRPQQLNDLAELVAQANGEVVGIWVHVNSQPGNGLFNREEDGTIGMRAISGKDWIDEDLDGIRVRMGPGDFFQTNPSMAMPLYKRTLDRLELGKKDTFVDLFCGVGGMTMLASRRAGFTVGVERVAGAITRARESARRNRLSLEFVAGDVLEVLPSLARRFKHPVMAVDPARRGLEPDILEAIIALKPSKIAYISCNARSMARDLAEFRAAGARIEPIEMFEMFPHTAHVELLTIIHFDVVQGRAPRRKLIRS